MVLLINGVNMNNQTKCEWSLSNEELETMYSDYRAEQNAFDVAMKLNY